MEKLIEYGIYLADVAFEDIPEYSKVRPVVILDVGIQNVRILKITSKIHQRNFPAYYIRNWMRYRLHVPSSIILRPIYHLTPDRIFTDRYLGKLSAKDQYAITAFEFGE